MIPSYPASQLPCYQLPSYPASLISAMPLKNEISWGRTSRAKFSWGFLGSWLPKPSWGFLGLSLPESSWTPVGLRLPGLQSPWGFLDSSRPKASWAPVSPRLPGFQSSWGFLGASLPEVSWARGFQDIRWEKSSKSGCSVGDNTRQYQDLLMKRTRGSDYSVCYNMAIF